jgi:hypothetical protein
MGWLSSTAKEPLPPTPEELAQQERERLEAKLKTALSDKPLFKVTTVDGMQWICPYTGQLVPAPFGYAEAGLAHLLAKEPWKHGGKLKAEETLVAIRWLHYLRLQQEMEPRLRHLLPDGRWLNPYSGELVTLPRRHADPMDEACRQDLARELARDPGTRPVNLLPPEQLEQVMRQGQTVKESQMDSGIISLSGMHNATKRSGPDIAGCAIAMRQGAQRAATAFAPLPDGGFIVVLAEARNHEGGAALRSRLSSALATATSAETAASLVSQCCGSAVRLTAVEIRPHSNSLRVLHLGSLSVITLDPTLAGPIKRQNPQGPSLEAGVNPPQARTVELTKGAMLVIAPEGLLKHNDADGRTYGAARHAGTALRHFDAPIESFCDQLIQDARSFAGGADPDASVLAIRQE